MVSVSTLLQQEDEEFEVAEFKLQSASGEGEVITVEEGLVTEKFNIAEKFLPEDIDRRSHSHLVDIEIPAVKLKKVSVFWQVGLLDVALFRISQQIPQFHK